MSILQPRQFSVIIVLVPTLHEELEEVFHRKMTVLNPRKILYLTESLTGSPNTIEDTTLSIVSKVFELLLVAYDPECKFSAICHFTLDVCERLGYRQYLKILIDSIIGEFVASCEAVNVECLGLKFIDQWRELQRLLRQSIPEKDLRKQIIQLCEEFLEYIRLNSNNRNIPWSKLFGELNRIITGRHCRDREAVIGFIDIIGRTRDLHFTEAIIRYISESPDKTLVVVQLGPAHVEHVKELLENKGYHIQECARINSEASLNKCIKYIKTSITEERDPEFDVIYDISTIEQRDPEFDAIYE